MLEEVLRFFDDTHDPEHPDTLEAVHNLAISYAAGGRRDEALEMREKVLTLRRKVLCLRTGQSAIVLSDSGPLHRL